MKHINGLINESLNSLISKNLIKIKSNILINRFKIRSFWVLNSIKDFSIIL